MQHGQTHVAAAEAVDPAGEGGGDPGCEHLVTLLGFKKRDVYVADEPGWVSSILAEEAAAPAVQQSKRACA